MTRFHTLAAAVSFAAFTSINAWAADPLPTETHKLLPLSLAVEVAQAAIASCKSQVNTPACKPNRESFTKARASSKSL